MNMNWTSGSNGIGPLELIYSAAEKVLQTTQGAVQADVISDFIESVRWAEPFIVSLIVMQVVLFIVTYMTRRQSNFQFCILLVLTLVTLSAERLNQAGKDNWHLFATQDYFDGSGLFMLTFVCGPFLLLANFIVVRCHPSSSFFLLVLSAIIPLSYLPVSTPSLQLEQIGMGMRLIKVYAMKKRRENIQRRSQRSDSQSTSNSNVTSSPSAVSAPLDKKNA